MTSTEVSPRIHPLADEALGNTSYLVAISDDAAILVDPRRDTDQYLALADRLDLQIVAVFETHLHADFVSGVREVARATGADIYAPEGAGLCFTHIPIVPASRLDLGDATIEAIETRGHTPEHFSYLLHVDGRAGLFSGGSLIFGGAARTDLSGPERTDELSRAQYQSLRRLAALPGETILYPTHGAGSFCSTGRARSTSSTIGAETASNPLLAIDDEQAFVEQLESGFGSYPRYFLHLRDLNRRGAPFLQELPPVREIKASDAASAVEQGAWLIDGRPVPDWAREHPAGAVSIEVRPAFGSWLGWVVPFDSPVVLVLQPEQVIEAARLARRIGYDRIQGWLPFESWLGAELPVASLDVVDAEEAAKRQAAGTVMLDVRQKSEYAASRITGAVHLELGDIIGRKSPDAQDVITYCGHGERSATAASLLERRGLRVANLDGGTSAWRDAGLPLER